MKISVFGMGYVGVVTAGCLSEMGHQIIGVDINAEKVNKLNEGISPIFEKGIDEIIHKNSKNGRLLGTTDPYFAIDKSVLSIICVGTPSLKNGSTNLEYIQKVCNEIGSGISRKSDFHSVVIRSTIPPSTTENKLIPILSKMSGKVLGEEFSVCYHPEFLREGSAIHDFYNPEMIVVGEPYEDAGIELMQLYENFDFLKIKTDVNVAEMLKYVNNSFHGLKVSFANEVGRLCNHLKVDSHKVMDIFCKDKKLNLSSYYLKPGFAFGGSCLPKEIRALEHNARLSKIQVPLINSILNSNESHVNYCVDLVSKLDKRKIGILGLAFKSGTNDLRESPATSLFNKLNESKKFEIKICDPNVSVNDLLQFNPEIISSFVEDIKEVIEASEVIVIVTPNEEFKVVNDLMSEKQILVDFVRLVEKGNIF